VAPDAVRIVLSDDSVLGVSWGPAPAPAAPPPGRPTLASQGVSVPLLPLPVRARGAALACATRMERLTDRSALLPAGAAATAAAGPLGLPPVLLLADAAGLSGAGAPAAPLPDAARLAASAAAPTPAAAAATPAPAAAPAPDRLLSAAPWPPGGGGGL
jgi:hypothetical protein